MSFQYAFNKAAINQIQLTEEIRDEPTLNDNGFEAISYNDPNGIAYFTIALTAPEQATLSTLVSAHAPVIPRINLDYEIPASIPVSGAFILPKKLDDENIIAREVKSLDASLDILESGDSISFQLATGTPSSGHEILDTLIHDIAENAYYEVVMSGINKTSETYWKPQLTTPKDNGKIREILYTYGGTIPFLATTIVIKQYESDGATVKPAIGTLTINVSYSGIFVANATMVKS